MSADNLSGDSMKRSINLGFILSLLLPVVLFAGCASLSEKCRVFLGTSTRALEEAKTTQFQSQVFEKDYPTLYQQVYDLLKKKGICIFLQSHQERRIVAMNFLGPADTTEVGIFFENLNLHQTKIIVTSLSPTRMVYAADMIFSELEPKTKPK
jgi:hypothetical protein